MKLCKLWTHQKGNFNGQDLVLNPKEFPDVQVGDVVEIYHPEDEYSRLLLQVTAVNDDFQQKDTVSVEQSIAALFQLRMYKDVCVHVVNKRDVTLDLLELTFKEQYFSRSDMWRLRKSLEDKCVYFKKKVEFADMRAQVTELWSKGDKVACGVVGENTRLTFRSSTAQVNIFLQMSSEMWEFDNYGDLYFEKAVGGFLTDLFALWKEQNCCHDVTITMFSRSFYDATSIEEFPPQMRGCLQQDYQGRFYEDFYRVVVQNERYDEWTPTIIQLKTLFHEYQKRVLHYHSVKNPDVPISWNSTAAQGNFLEVLNMGLNVFEKYYLDRPFDRTGKLSMVITPSCGVFEVDRGLANITKQRTIDCGNGSDLVCLGEQPLHAVPLFKFHNKSQRGASICYESEDFEFRGHHTNIRTSLDVGDDYNIPHWINHSFYTSRSQAEKMSQGKFIPRIKIPPALTSAQGRKKSESTSKMSPKVSVGTLPSNRSQYPGHEEELPFTDYDEYDAQVFKLPSSKTSNSKLSLQRRCTSKVRSYSTVEEKVSYRRKVSHHSSDIEESGGSREGSKSPSQAISIPGRKVSSSQDLYLSSSYHAEQSSSQYGSREELLGHQCVGSVGTPAERHSKHSLYNYRPKKALINPFAPSRLHFKVTSNRRRWAHAYPTDLKGATVQLHHQHSQFGLSESGSYHYGQSPPNREIKQGISEYRRPRTHRVSESSESGEQLIRSKTGSSAESSEGGKVTYGGWGPGLTPVSSSSCLSKGTGGSTNSLSSVPILTEYVSSSVGNRARTISMGLSRQSSVPRDMSQSEEGRVWLWGLTGEQEWTPDLTTGMDWKSLTFPASLPISTDYFPDQRTLDSDYLMSEYNILQDEGACNSGRKLLTTLQVFKEMVAQRLAQGFQIVVTPRPLPGTQSSQILSSSPFQGSLPRGFSLKDQDQTYTLSIGRLFHRLHMSGGTITVTKYWPKFPYPVTTYHYKYRFQVPDSEMYDVSWTKFCNEQLENYNWNHLDLYILTRGEGEYVLRENLKYWRSRFFLLPSINTATKKIMEGAERCDIYEPISLLDQQQLIDGFLRWIEATNKIRRPGQSRKPKIALSRRSSMSLMASSQGITEKALDITRAKVAAVEARKIASSQSACEIESLPGTPGVSSDTQVFPSKGEKSGLMTTSSLKEVASAMLDPNEGLCFLPTNHPYLPELPKYTLVSSEATAWVLGNLDDVYTHDEAVNFLQHLIDEGHMCHASMNPKHLFIHGFYLYCMITEGKEALCNTAFQFEWCEVAELPNKCEESTFPQFLLEPLPRKQDVLEETPFTYDVSEFSPPYGGSPDRMEHQTLEDLQALLDEDQSVHEGRSPPYKLVVVDVDPTKKSDREEWGTARYHGNYCPTAAFELGVHWLVATGAILGDLVSSWARKASTCNFHFLPVPVDLFALPYTQNSDPLRGPIFVPLRTQCLHPEGQPLFHEFEPETRQMRLQLFQESILKRFGFLPVSYYQMQYDVTDQSSLHLQYVHCSGSMFTLIPDDKALRQQSKSSLSSSPSKQHRESKSSLTNSPDPKVLEFRTLHGKSPDNRSLRHRPPSPYDLMREYIRTRAESYAEDESSYGVGFLWCWNFMLTKRLRTSVTGDENFQNKMLSDFRAFCRNDDNRLSDYWESCKSQMGATMVTDMDNRVQFDIE